MARLATPTDCEDDAIILHNLKLLQSMLCDELKKIRIDPFIQRQKFHRWYGIVPYRTVIGMIYYRYILRPYDLPNRQQYLSSPSRNFLPPPLPPRLATALATSLRPLFEEALHRAPLSSMTNETNRNETKQRKAVLTVGIE